MGRSVLTPLALAVSFAAVPSAPSAALGQKPAAKHIFKAGLPTEFQANLGQWDPSIKFAARAGAVSAGFEQGGIRLRMGGERTALLKLTFDGGRKSTPIRGEGKRPGRYQYFLGRDSARWKSGVPAFTSILYRGVYPGVDIRVRGVGPVLEYDLLLEPGADLSNVRIKAEGASELRETKEGSLELHTPSGILSQDAPKTWEVLPNGRTRPVDCRIRKLGPDRFGFEAPGWDSRRPLVIDPGLEWASFLGGNEREEITGLAATSDGTGDVVVCGRTFSLDFPATSGSLGARPVVSFVARLSGDGRQLRYGIMFGGTRLYSDAYDVALDSAGAPIVVGTTRASDHPVTPGAYDTTYNGNDSVGDDVFVTKFNPAGTALVFSTFLGASPTGNMSSAAGSEHGSQVAVDSAGNVVVAGNTWSPDFPTTPGAYSRTLQTIFDPAKQTVDGSDIFVARFDPTGSQLTYSTFLGGQGWETVSGMAVDPLGFVTITGSAMPMQDIDASGNAFPIGTPMVTTPDALLRDHRDNYYSVGDSYIARLKPDGAGTADLKYSTIIGGWSSDRSESIALDPNNPELVTIAGYTYSWNFRTTKGTGRRGPISQDDWHMAFISRYRFPASGGGILEWSTLLGGPGYTAATDVTVNELGEAIMAGWGGMDFPTTPRSYMRVGVSQDGILARVSKDGDRIDYATLLGGSVGETYLRIASAGGSSVLVSGWTTSPDFPVTPGAHDTIINSDGSTTPPFHWQQDRMDGFLARLTLEPNPTLDTTAPTPALLSPADGAVFPEPTQFELPTVMFDWSDVADSSGVLAYQIEISPDPDFFLNRLNVAPWVVLEPKESQATVTFSSFFGHFGIMYWRVRTLDGANNWSDWSAARVIHLGQAQIPRISHVTLSVPEVIGGGIVQGTAVLRNMRSPAGGTVLNVRSNNTAVATVPSQILVPAGADRVTFNITTKAVSRSTPALISVDDTGLPDSKTLWVEPGAAPPPSLSGLALSPTTVTGGASSTGTVALTAPAPSGGKVITLSSGNTNVATVPASVSVAAGQSSATFTVSSRSVTTSTAVTITGTMDGVSRAAVLTVNPPPTVTLASLTLNPTSVTGGQSVTGTVTLSGGAPSGGAVVALSSTNTNAATVPASVTISAGATSATFTVSSRTVSSTTTVSIRGTYAGLTRSASLTVNPAASTSDTVSITRAEYDSGARRLRVEATSTRSAATVRVYVTSTNALIGTLTNDGGGRYRGEFSWSSNPGSITVKSSLGGSATRSVTLK